MANDLNALIRLQNWRVDEQRRRIGELLRQAARIEAQRAALEAEVAREQKVAHGSFDFGLTYAHYASAVIRRRRKLADALIKVEREIARVQDDLAGEFRALKSYEITQAARDREAALHRARQEQAMLDEFAVDKFQSRGNGTPRM